MKKLVLCCATHVWAGDVDRATEHYATYKEANADRVDKLAERLESGNGIGDAEYAEALREGAAGDREDAALARSAAGREHLRRTGLWLTRSCVGRAGA
ncbi:hypothetical protein ACFRSX_32470 [Streptomyces goshikiensis]|uniref:hypothetical protein n=1 Tax=Streptomyces TaxID=1883 RepID=UPI000C2774E0|nr:hypothetical protein [Streptomyces sp. CB02120-2]PJN14505.1 hypothetical protein CG724_32935 [Streptomyces sp. CB02120-2]